MMENEEKVRGKFAIDSEVNIPEYLLDKFLPRLDVVRRRDPELFSTVASPVVAQTKTLYVDRVQQVLEARARGIDLTLDPDNLDPQKELNVNLLIALEKEMVKRTQKAQKKKVPETSQLPILAHREEILETIVNNQVVVIRGETGCGKTTQVPQFILDSYIKKKRGTDCRIVCTQPRRVAAISIACRVAEERKEELGGGKSSVGFLIRCENEMPRPEGGTILYVTIGVLLRQLNSDPALRHLTHVIVDEVHERSSESDLLLGVLKMLLPLRPDLRVIIMSATIEADQFSKYFGNCPTLEVSGFNYEVEEVYKEQIMREINMPLNTKEWKLGYLEFTNKLITELHTKKPPGAILVFCTGYDEIEKLYQRLKQQKDATMKIYILHSLVPVRKERIFSKPKEGDRKIILSTNVAESSITIDDVVYVIDNGRLKVMSYATNSNMYALENSWITKANARQRKGRAGRCQNGIVYRLYTKQEYEKMEDFVRSHLTRDRLDSVILDLKMWNFGPVQEFLASLISPPKVENVNFYIKELRKMGALTGDEQLTTFGRKLALMHLDPRLGMMMIYAAMFKCLDPITTVVAFLSFKDIFMLSLGNKKSRKELKSLEEGQTLHGMMEFQLDLDAGNCSDHMMRIKAMQKFLAKGEDARYSYCYESYLNESTMTQITAMRKQIAKGMARVKLIGKEDPSLAEDNERSVTQYLHMIRSVICGGLSSNTVGFKEVEEKKGKATENKKYLFFPDGKKGVFHKSSVNSQKLTFDTAYFVYYKAVSTNQIFIHDSTMIHSLAVCIFSDAVVYYPQKVVVNNFFHFFCSSETQRLIESLRRGLKNIFTRMVNSRDQYKFNGNENELLGIVAEVLALEEYTE